MPKYKLVEMPDVHNTGKRKVYPKMVVNRTMSQADFIEHMKVYNRSLPPSTVEMAVTEVRDMLVRLLAMGYNVSLDELGTFSLSLGFEDDKPTEMQSDKDKMIYRKVGVRSVNFAPSPKLIKDIKQETDRDLERDMAGVKVIRKEVYTREQRIARALDAIDKNGFIGLTDYAAINNLSRTAASLELKEVCADENAPIRSTGQHSHKVWVRRKE